MLQVPDEITLFGITHDIRPMDGVSKADTLGLFIARTASIMIDDDMSQDMQMSTLLHELVHLIQYHLGLNLDEQVANSLAAGIHEVFKNNPGLVECYAPPKRKK